jgi:hypothetical protein
MLIGSTTITYHTSVLPASKADKPRDAIQPDYVLPALSIGTEYNHSNCNIFAEDIYL